MRKELVQFGLRVCLALAALWAVARVASAQEAPPAQEPNETNTSAESADPALPPIMFPHPETDRLWISGQANIISQWHPAFRSPYQGRNSLSPEAQDASSRVHT